MNSFLSIQEEYEMLVTAWYPSSPFTSPPIINSSGRSGIYDVGRSEFRRTRSMVESPLETRISLVVALATQANSLSQRGMYKP